MNLTSTFSTPLSPPIPPNNPTSVIITEQPSPKRRRVASSLRPPAAVDVSTDLGTYIKRDVQLLREKGWKNFVTHRRKRGDFADVSSIPHPAKRLLQHYKVHGAPVKFSTRPWKEATIERALARGPHRSCMEHIEFLHE